MPDNTITPTMLERSVTELVDSIKRIDADRIERAFLRMPDKSQLSPVQIASIRLALGDLNHAIDAMTLPEQPYGQIVGKIESYLAPRGSAHSKQDQAPEQMTLSVEERVSEAVLALRQDSPNGESIRKALNGIKDLVRDDLTPLQQRALQDAGIVCERNLAGLENIVCSTIREVAPTDLQLQLAKATRPPNLGDFARS